MVIAADKDARYEDVLGVLDLLQRNGVQQGRPARAPAGELMRRMTPTAPRTPARGSRGKWLALALAIAVHLVVHRRPGLLASAGRTASPSR